MNGTNGKQSDFPDVALVPYPVIVAATKGDRLCAKEIIGNRANLTKWQDDFHACIPESLKEALAAFFIANAVRDLRGDTKSHRTMMINISRFIAIQNQITKVVDGYVRDWKREIHNYYLTGEEALC